VRVVAYTFLALMLAWQAWITGRILWLFWTKQYDALDDFVGVRPPL